MNPQTMNPIDHSDRIVELERDAYFASVRLELNRASFRYGDKAVFEFIQSIVCDFNSKATVFVDHDDSL